MKLNNLIKYNSLKVFSILGYVFAVLFILIMIGWHHALILDKASGLCFEETPYPCETGVYDTYLVQVYLRYVLISAFMFLPAAIEFLYKKYKSKDTKIKTYSKPWTIIFWIGLILEVLPFLFFVLLYIYYLYDDYIRFLF